MPNRQNDNRRRRQVEVIIGSPYTSGRLSDLQLAINEANIRAASEGIDRLSYEIDYEKGYYDSVSITFSFKGWRDETDEEQQFRSISHGSMMFESWRTR